ncbi:fimbrial assembly protein FimA, partial [Kouleothrix aurantiaca]
MSTRIIATFSIVARDPANGDLGAAVASKFLAVGSVVPWAQAGAGALATQALANIGFGPRGLALMAAGQSADAALAALLADDPDREQRPVGLVDAQGRAAAHTGAACFSWAGHHVGAGFAAQGNILAGPEVVDALAHAFTNADGELAERLLAALAAGDAA